MNILPLRFVVLLLLTAILAGCQPPSGIKKEAKEKPAKAAPVSVKGEISIRKIDGSGTLALEDLKGKPVILYFMAPWTDGGRASLDWLSKGEVGGVSIIPLVVDQKLDHTSSEGVVEQLKSMGAYMADAETMNAVGGIRALPTAVLISAEGTVMKKWMGFVSPENMAADLSTPDGSAPASL